MAVPTYFLSEGTRFVPMTGVISALATVEGLGHTFLRSAVLNAALMESMMTTCLARCTESVTCIKANWSAHA